MTEKLALHGGDPVWTGSWPAWPELGRDTVHRVERALHSGRWAVSGTWTGRSTLDLELSARFAEFVGARWCIPCDHGSSALLAGLHALGVKPGDEVIVPGLTWVACASVVARAGAIPILVDVDPQTLCLDPVAVEAAITEATSAILVVHLYSAMADMDTLGEIARRHGLPIVEDSAQAYGASWRGRMAGSLGAVGTFSAQQGKTLTSGEGGLLVTSDEELRNRAEMLRGDGRRYLPHPPPIGRPDLEELRQVQGWNMHLTEMQAALLLDGLDRLADQNKRRAIAADTLDRELGQAGDLELITPYAGNDQRSYYHYSVSLHDGAFGGQSAEAVARALSAELGYWVHPPYRPLNSHPLFDPRRLPVAASPAAEELMRRWDPAQFDLPVAHRAAERTILLHHPMLLGGPDHINSIVDAFGKVRRLAVAI